jgi:hypothetical protein
MARGPWSRLGWFALYWLAGVLALTAVAYPLRWLLLG